ncbi:MAG: hypothetical protein HY533_06710 [Chloroflexi bacterium]|nr:hypothetical protein [Chloroflexota bacterium]
MNKSVAIGYAVGIVGLLLAGFALLAPARLVNAAREQLPVNKTAIVDANFPERSASVDALGRLKVDVPDYLHVQVTNFPPMQQVQVANKSLPVDGTVKVSNLPAVQSVTGVVNVGNLPARQNVNVINDSLPVTGSVVVSNMPTVQQVNVANPVTVGNFPSIDPTRIVNFSALKVGNTDPVEACNAGFIYSVPIGKTLLITDVVVSALSTDIYPFPGIWSNLRGNLIRVIAPPDGKAFQLNSPLMAFGGEQLCVYKAGGSSSSFDLFFSGQLVDAP